MKSVIKLCHLLISMIEWWHYYTINFAISTFWFLQNGWTGIANFKDLLSYFKNINGTFQFKHHGFNSLQWFYVLIYWFPKDRCLRNKELHREWISWIIFYYFAKQIRREWRLNIIRRIYFASYLAKIIKSESPWWWITLSPIGTKI